MDHGHVEKRSTQVPDNLSAFRLFDFANKYLQGGEDMCHFSRAPLQSPLLNIIVKEDAKASCAISIAILRFMTDLPEARVSNRADETKTNGEEISPVKPTKAYSSGSTFKRTIVDEKTQMASLTTSSVPSVAMMNRPTTNMEKIHFITSYGIRKPVLRDEIYCQICRQLVNNMSKTSCTRGWILLALCAGVFAPSDELLNYVRNFMKQGPGAFGEYCFRILQRTVENNCRRQPPTTLELEAVKTQSKISLYITFMDGTTMPFEIDAATTCQELCQMIKKSLGMNDMFGFSIFVAAVDQVANWGCGHESILDAVSLAEQYASSRGQHESDAWQLFLRKDIFEPKFRPSENRVATDLIYHQVMGGITEEEYICSKNTDLVDMVVKRYYLENGSELADDLLWKVTEATLPPFVLEHVEQNGFFNKVKEAFNKNSFVNARSDPQEVKEDVARYAQANWPTEFSRVFDAFVASGGKLPKIAVKLAVNSKGLLVYPQEDGNATRLLELGYSHIKQITSIRKGMYLDSILIISTKRSTSYEFRTVHADGLSELLNTMLTSSNDAGVDSD